MKERIVPSKQARIDLQVKNSTFIATGAPTRTVEEAKVFINHIKAEFSDATHNVPAFIIGHGSTRILHSSDDGEPSGTAGRPVLAVLEGSQIGDITVVVTRYFGGAKLGTAGLVRAYQDSAKQLISALPKGRKTEVAVMGLEIPYSLYEQVERLIRIRGGGIIDQTFETEVKVIFEIEAVYAASIRAAINEITRGKAVLEIIDEKEAILNL